MTYVALDFETSGLDPKRHAPIGLGVALMEEGEPRAAMSWLIGPTRHYKTNRIEREYDVAALEVSGITWSQITDASQPPQIVSALDLWVNQSGARGLPVVAFNAPFDLAFYSELLYLASGWHPTERGVKVPAKDPLGGPWICVRMMAINSLRLTRYSLDDVAQHYGLARTSGIHDASEDAILAGRVYWRLLCQEQVAR